MADAPRSDTEFASIVEEVGASLGGLTSLEPVWSDEHERWVLLVLRNDDGSELAALSERTANGLVVISVENLWFLPYDGSPKPYSRDGHNPLGVAVHGAPVDDGVTACRVGNPRKPTEELIVGGRWYRCIWDVRPWGPWSWPELREMHIGGRWVEPVVSTMALTREGLVRLIADADPGADAWSLLDKVVEDDPGAAWGVMVRLADALTEDQLGYLGAGAMENWFRACGHRQFNAIEGDARRSRKVALALHGVWAYDAPARGRLDRLLTELGLPPGPLP